MFRFFSTRVVKVALSHKRRYAPLINSPIVVLVVDGNEARTCRKIDRIRSEVGREINSRLKGSSRSISNWMFFERGIDINIIVEIIRKRVIRLFHFSRFIFIVTIWERRIEIGSIRHDAFPKRLQSSSISRSIPRLYKCGLLRNSSSMLRIKFWSLLPLPMLSGRRTSRLRKLWNQRHRARSFVARSSSSSLGGRRLAKVDSADDVSCRW